MFFYLIVFLIAALPAFAAENKALPNLSSIRDPSQVIDHEIKRLDHLIQATKHSLENQKILRERILDYKKVQQAYELHPNDNEILYQMVKVGHRLLESIKENHLTQNFDPEFLSELTALSQFAAKRGIPKP